MCTRVVPELFSCFFFVEAEFVRNASRSNRLLKFLAESFDLANFTECVPQKIGRVWDLDVLQQKIVSDTIDETLEMRINTTL